MDNNILDQYVLPDGAAEAIAKQGFQPQNLGDGVTIMSGHDAGVAYKFFIYKEYNPVKSDIAGYEVFDEIEAIQWFVTRLFKPTGAVSGLSADRLKFNRFGECIGGTYKDAYLRFKEGREAEGLPLEKWGVLTDGECSSLAADGIFSVEQFAEYPTDRIQGVYPEQFVEAHKRAKQYTGGKESNEKHQAVVAELTELKDKYAEFEAKVKAQEEEFEARVKATAEKFNKKVAAKARRKPRGKSNGKITKT